MRPSSPPSCHLPPAHTSPLPRSWYKQVLSQTGFAPPIVQDLRPFPEKLLISSRNIIQRHSTKTKKLGAGDYD